MVLSNVDDEVQSDIVRGSVWETAELARLSLAIFPVSSADVVRECFINPNGQSSNQVRSGNAGLDRCAQAPSPVSCSRPDGARTGDEPEEVGQDR